MSTPLEKLPTWSDDGVLNVVVECPRGSLVKIKHDPKLGVFRITRPLPLGVVFPFEFGFVPKTKAADGDPLDVAVLLDVPTYPGVVVPSRPIGVVRASQRGEGGRVRNDRVVAIAEADRRHGSLRQASDLSARERGEIENFFKTAVALEGKELEILGWGDARAARNAIDAATKTRGVRKRRPDRKRSV